MNCKPGDLAVIVGGLPEMSHNIGRVITVVGWFDDHYQWMTDHKERGAVLCVADQHLRPIRDNPGNESFVTEARKSLPRTKDAVRITERGEVA